MKILKGTTVASGLVRGTVCLYTSETDTAIAHYEVPVAARDGEIARLDAALERSREEMRRMVTVAQAQFDKKAAEIFTAHLMILSDEGLRRRIVEMIAERGINAEHAVSDVFDDYIKRYKSAEGHFQELTHDFVDTRDRIIGAFSDQKGGFKCEVGMSKPVVVAAERLTPSMVLSIPKEHALAFIAKEGGYTSHATILARSFGVPVMFGIDVEHELECGMDVVVDAVAGKLIVAPDDEKAAAYEKRMRALAERRGVCEAARHLSARTRAGRRITLKANISTPPEMALLEGLPYDGIGLLRTEFLFMQRDHAPSEDEQFKLYRGILAAAAPRPVTVRLLDIGSDKLPAFLKLPPSVNADMELRGALAVETFPDLYLTQVKALLRANTAGNLRLLYPMASDHSDLATFRSIVSQARQELKRSGSAFNTAGLKEGVMIETPGAVMMADELLAEVDFANIGSNDLLQYTLAAARGNPLAEKRYHIMHPALVKLLSVAAAAGKRSGKEVCLCGEIASFEEFYPVLLQAGLEHFSVAVSRFADIKCRLMHLQAARRSRLLDEFYHTRSKDDADRYLARYAD